MTLGVLLGAALLVLAPQIAGAQHGSYSGQERREIKALSADETKQYLSGAGMGHARAAELNGFPGPMHVLELADKLQLSSSQHEAVLQSARCDRRRVGETGHLRRRRGEQRGGHGDREAQLAEDVGAEAPDRAV